MLGNWISFVVWTTLLALHLNGAHAFWRLLCDGSVGLARIDPLTNIGTASEHVHSIKGGSGESSPHWAAHLHLKPILSTAAYKIFHLDSQPFDIFENELY